jgi:hypothetical protein
MLLVFAASGCSSTASSNDALATSTADVSNSPQAQATTGGNTMPESAGAAAIQSAAAAQAASAQSAAAQSAAAESSAAQAAADQAAAAQSAAESAAAEQAAAQQSAAEQAAKQEAADRLAADMDEAAGLQDAAIAAGWVGPICSPDTNLHLERSGQAPLTDDELAAECEAQISDAKNLIAEKSAAEDSAAQEGWYTPSGNWVSPETAARAIAAGISPGETVPNYLRCGTICGEGPTSGEVQMAQLCKDGTISADQCAGIDPDAIIAAASSYSGW